MDLRSCADQSAQAHADLRQCITEGGRCEEESERARRARQQLDAAKRASEARELQRLQALAITEERERVAQIQAEKLEEQRKSEMEANAFREASEQRRAYQANEAAAKEAEQQRATLARQEPIAARARALGFKKVVFVEDGGLRGGLEEAIARAAPMSELRATAMELAEGDAGFVVAQIQPGAALLVHDDNAALRVLLRGAKRTIYEGSPLTALGFVAVRVVAVQTYRTALGGSAQAFVVEPAW